MGPGVAEGQLAQSSSDGRAKREGRGLGEVTGRTRRAGGVRKMFGENLTERSVGDAIATVEIVVRGMGTGIS